MQFPGAEVTQFGVAVTPGEKEAAQKHIKPPSNFVVRILGFCLKQGQSIFVHFRWFDRIRSRPCIIQLLLHIFFVLTSIYVVGIDAFPCSNAGSVACLVRFPVLLTPSHFLSIFESIKSIPGDI
jgi:hypothetical protein